MTRRGRILRDTAAGAGLVVVDGTQLPFTLESMWTSETPPVSGMVVDVEVDGGSVVTIAAVPEGQLAREQAERALTGAKERGAALANVAVARFGVPALVAAAALIVGWLFLTAGSLTTPLGRIDLTFWDVLGAVNSGAEGMVRRMTGSRASTGIYGFLAVLAIAGPFLTAAWKDRRAHLAGLLPMLLMLVVAWKVWHLGGSVDTSAASQFGAAGADFAGSIADRVRDEVRRSISIGAGAYVSGAAAVYFAMVSVRRYLAASARAV